MERGTVAGGARQHSSPAPDRRSAGTQYLVRSQLAARCGNAVAVEHGRRSEAGMVAGGRLLASLGETGGEVDRVSRFSTGAATRNYLASGRNRGNHGGLNHDCNFT